MKVDLQRLDCAEITARAAQRRLSSFGESRDFPGALARFMLDDGARIVVVHAPFALVACRVRCKVV
jgi:hypothetical protein